MPDLKTAHCKPRKGDGDRLSPERASTLKSELHEDWTLSADNQVISRVFKFSNYYETIAFVNALAWVAHREDHHPDLEVGYNRCTVNYSTHSVGGLSENDFICALRIDTLASDRS